MGHAVADVVAADPLAELVAAFGRPEAGSALPEAVWAADVIIDFTSATASVDLAEQAAARGGPALVIGSTGFESDDLVRIEAAARRIAIVRSGSYSLGVNMLVGLVARAARSLPPNAWDIEIFEAHHRRKVDAPSGTALMLGEAAARGRDVSLESTARRVRDGITGPRSTGEIGFSVMRGGGIVGEHGVVFAADDEILTLSHSARDRSMFARGALAAARWVVGRPAGQYDMQDVLGFGTDS